MIPPKNQPSGKVACEYPYRPQTHAHAITDICENAATACHLPPETFTITIVAGPGPVPAIIRVRQLLKIALRAFKLTCTSIKEVNPNEQSK